MNPVEYGGILSYNCNVVHTQDSRQHENRVALRREYPSFDLGINRNVSGLKGTQVQQMSLRYNHAREKDSQAVEGLEQTEVSVKNLKESWEEFLKHFLEQSPKQSLSEPCKMPMEEFTKEKLLEKCLVEFLKESLK
ncbi:hypothetical protein RP20_CCG005607 [Aedes albopictus]|nr:hypothetical protein RP20_CCG005607 [Aedes albopictus]